MTLQLQPLHFAELLLTENVPFFCSQWLMFESDSFNDFLNATVSVQHTGWHLFLMKSLAVKHSVITMMDLNDS